MDAGPQVARLRSGLASAEEVTARLELRVMEAESAAEQARSGEAASAAVSEILAEKVRPPSPSPLCVQGPPSS